MPADEWSPRFWLGADVAALSGLVLRNRLALRSSDWPSFAVHVAFAAVHTALGGVERVVYDRRLAKTKLREDPIFVLGHWRTGTTLVHELLALDARHTAPTTYQCLSPCHFLLTESWLPKLSRFALPSRRPADNVTLAWEKPQEEEFALTLLGVPSPYATIAFPNRAPAFPAYLDLANLDAEALARWSAAFLHFLKRVSYRDPRRLVLKSPAHTARTPVLRALFPGARFVHLVRDPYRVFVSTMHLWRAMYTEQAYQAPPFAQLEEQVFETYLRVFRRLEADRASFAPGQFCEVRYEDLVRDPAEVVRGIYETLGLGEFAAYRPKLERYLEGTRGYETNTYEIPPALCREIARRWAPAFAAHGYPVRPNGGAT